MYKNGDIVYCLNYDLSGINPSVYHVKLISDGILRGDTTVYKYSCLDGVDYVAENLIFPNVTAVKKFFNGSSYRELEFC